MNIVSSSNNNITKIIVEELEKTSQIEELLLLLKTDDFIEINFLNIQIIPKEIILELKKIKNRITIFTNEVTLKNYLLSLGFSLQFQDNYKDKLKTLNLKYIAIGGSAGSLKRFIKIIEELPKSDMSIFIIMHRKENKESSLAKILQNSTQDYTVVEAQSDMKIESATIYVAPANKHMIIAGGFIFLTDSAKRNYSRPSISNTFESLSNEFKNTLLTILISGYGADGADSLELLQKNETTILIEDPKECEAKPMLENAIQTKLYDQVLSIDDINRFIKNSFENNFFTDDEIKEFLVKIYDTYGYDYSNYHIEHIKRRVHLFFSTLKTNSFAEFEEIVLNNKNIFKDLFLNISVNITTFYRNPEVFKILRNEILPKLDSFLDIKVWCAGCSSGEEPYSIAIFLKELGLLDRSLIYATDLNSVILKNAQNGLYPKESYNSFLKNYYESGGDESFSQYFINHDDFVEVKEEIKEKILFFRHNLALDSKINDFQLIFCRNVLIYFDKDLKERIFTLFNQSLDSYGFLVLGESESLEHNNKFTTIDKTNKIYKRSK